MAAPAIQRFDTRAAFQAHLGTAFGRARATLDLFDPDCTPFALGAPETDALLRGFLRHGGRLRLAMHTATALERTAPRFLRLLRDYEHAIACRLTPRALRDLTDSFCIADDLHIVRRFHADHWRGEAAFDAPQEIDVSRERFSAIWGESLPGLRAATTGL
ncbi:hypothetical protein [uncultured Massilia sp.]|uniref:DUF7931 domain-containing protein n=1 Tax=uncultured Massilia sp. TaxID=169973 RepID=UPI0025EB8071|nr:hypothetical protein [uncultured Massilia sp.]